MWAADFASHQEKRIYNQSVQFFNKLYRNTSGLGFQSETRQFDMVVPCLVGILRSFRESELYSYIPLSFSLSLCWLVL